MELSIVIVALLLALCNAQLEEKTLPCGALFRCSMVEDPVWVTDGKKCYVFRNACLLGIENCNRENNHLPKLEVIPKEKCQTLCDVICPKKRDPVCGEYNGQQVEFFNRCMMLLHMCITGETILNVEPCPTKLDVYTL